MGSKPEHYDIALVGLGIGANYGSMLTYYSISETLKSFGKSVLLVNKIAAKSNDPEAQFDAPAVRFANEHSTVSSIYDYEHIADLNQIVDTFVIGTDQVWNYGIARGARESFYLDFVEANKRKISIAASMGHPDDFVPEEKYRRVLGLLSHFNAISVRESDAVKVLREKYNLTATQIIEPVFYTANQKYFELAERSTEQTGEPYLLSYILDHDVEKRQAVQTVANRLGLKVKELPDGFEQINGRSIYEVTNRTVDTRREIVEHEKVFQPEDFLKLFQDANYIITDSFHGSAFAVKFNKNFISLVNNGRGGSRFETLFSQLNLPKERKVYDVNVITKKLEKLIQPIDYTQINGVIDKEVKRAYEWINSALNVRIEPQQVSQTKELLLSHSYDLYRKGKLAPIAQGIKFQANGTFTNLSTVNEATWLLSAQQLKFVSRDKKVTTVFDINNWNGQTAIEGKFLADEQITHILRPHSQLAHVRSVGKKIKGKMKPAWAVPNKIPTRQQIVNQAIHKSRT